MVLAFARLESRFQNGSTSVAGAHGIMQLMPKTAELIAGKAGGGGMSRTMQIQLPEFRERPWIWATAAASNRARRSVT